VVVLITALFVVALALIVPLLIVRGSEEAPATLADRMRIASEASGEPLSGRRFLLLGFTLFACKYAADAFVAWQVFRVRWLPWHYLMPGSVSGGLVTYSFYAVLGSMAVPFLWLGVSLTLRRLRTLRRSPWLALLFFVPIFNLVFFFLIARDAAAATMPLVAQEPPKYGSVRGLLIASIALVPAAMASIALGTKLLGNYGWGLFVSVPYIVGFVSAAIYNRGRVPKAGESATVGLAAILVVGLGLLGFGIEGIVCLAMAAPMVAPFAMLGGATAAYCAKHGWRTPESPSGVVAGLLLMPLLMVGEHQLKLNPVEYKVVSAVVVHAPRQRVWNELVAFSEIPPPTEPLFRAGVAYPLCARIQGHGVGATRYCVFSTGAFVEPIEVWQEPELLRFGVKQQPQSMRELSPFEIRPRHVREEYFRATRGQFRLVSQPDGSTLLEGTTWYTLRYWPASYWKLWSDTIVHRIHLRVLDHIRSEAEHSS
jgi:uncharacterized membrane protein YhaH (DUF805 family)